MGGLRIMVAMLPTILLLIFRSFWQLKAGTLAQKLQTSFFVPGRPHRVSHGGGGRCHGICNDCRYRSACLARLAWCNDATTTYLYMKCLVLHWVTHAQQMMRHVML